MNKDIKELPSLKEVERKLFSFLQEKFKEMLVDILQEVDQWILENRDTGRYALKDRRKFTLDTIFGTFDMKRRTYYDREAKEYVALLDQYLAFDGKESLSPFLEEVAVEWAVKGPSYRDARDRIEGLVGYRVMSHERIRQKVLELEKTTTKTNLDDIKQAHVIFLEVDGVYASLQREKKGNREVKVGIMHEGWEKESPGSPRYQLKKKKYAYTTQSSNVFWEEVHHMIESHYELSKDTHIVINGDAAPWIREGVHSLPNALYVYDQYHLKKWIKQAMRKRSKKERRKAYLAADKHDPVELLVAMAEAQKAETDTKAKEDISALREFILANQDAIRDYRERLREKGVDTAGMRPMGAAEANMDMFANRLKKRGYSWSLKGLDAMVYGLISMFEG